MSISFKNNDNFINNFYIFYITHILIQKIIYDIIIFFSIYHMKKLKLSKLYELVLKIEIFPSPRTDF